ncbi:MAG: ABC transporter permease [Acidimicrobiia bacterium]|nr:ABC transporter permease [Acidimicrobiia bacterium]
MRTVGQVRAAATVEWWKLRRSTVTWTTTALMVVLMPAMSAAFYSVAINGGSGALASKAEIFLSSPGWEGYLGMTGQISAAAALVGVGVVVSWVFGREHADGTFPALFALPVRRDAIALAKLMVLTMWVGVVSAAVVVTSWAAGALVVGSGSATVEGLAELGLVTLLTGISGIAVSLFASAGRGYLPGVGATILLIISAQVSVLFGTGGWFPPAVPGLIAVQGATGIPTVSWIQIVAVPLLTGVVSATTVAWWRHAEVA